jgi:hypothetical protein
MGGRGAPDDLRLGSVTQGWLAVSEEPKARVSGHYFYRQALRETHPAAHDTKLQDALVAYCASLTNIELAVTIHRGAIKSGKSG